MRIRKRRVRRCVAVCGTGFAVLVMVLAIVFAPPSIPSRSNPVAGWNAREALDTLVVKGRAPRSGYSRSEFGSPWLDVDENGCDTRNDILQRDLRDITYRADGKNCIVQTGVLLDPYTATRIDFIRGYETSQAVQIDHVVALADAWQKGAQQLTEEERLAFANDPYNLLAVQGEANQNKKAGDIATWQPSNRDFLCDYAARQVGVKAKYGLWVTQAERDRFRVIFGTCPEQTIPVDAGVP